MSIVPISEIFTSPNGEGITTGLMTLFVRTSGCNFAIQNHPCPWCDTPYAWYPSQSKFSMTPEELKEKVNLEMLRQGLREICLTGGEPLFHVDLLKELIHYWSKKYHLIIETNGSLPIWKEECSWSIDLKCPSSGNSKYIYSSGTGDYTYLGEKGKYTKYDNLEILTDKDQLKCVIANRDDFNFARDLVKSRAVLTNVIFQPAWRLLPHSKLIEWVKEDRDIVGIVRIGDQMHKRWYPRRKKGV